MSWLASNEDADARIAALEKAIRQKDSHYSCLQNEFDKSKAELVTTQHSLQDVQWKLSQEATLRTTAEKALEKQSTEVKSFHSLKHNYESTIQTQTDKIARLERDAKTLQRELEGVQDSRATADDRVLKEKVALTKRNDMLEAELRSARSALAALPNGHQPVLSLRSPNTPKSKRRRSSSFSGTASINPAADQELEALRLKLAKSDQELIKTSNTLMALQKSSAKEIENAKSRIEELEDDLAALQEASSEQISSLQHHNTALESQKSTLQQLVNVKGEEVTTLAQELDRVKDRESKLSDELTKSETSHAASIAIIQAERDQDIQNHEEILMELQALKQTHQNQSANSKQMQLSLDVSREAADSLKAERDRLLEAQADQEAIKFKVESLEAALIDSKVNTENAEQRCKVVEAEYEAVATERDGLVSQIDSLKKDLHSKQDKVKWLQDEIEALQSRLAELEECNASFVDARNIAYADCRRFQAEADAALTKVADLQDQIIELEKQKEAASTLPQRSFDDEIVKSLQEDHKNAQNEVEQLSKQLKDFKNQEEAVVKERAEFVERIAILEESSALLKGQEEELRRTEADLLNKLQISQSAFDNLSQNLQQDAIDFQNRFAEKEAEIQALKDEAEAREAEMLCRQIEIHTQEEIQDLKSRYDTLLCEKQAAITDLNDLRNAHANLEHEVEKLQDLKHQLEAAQDQLSRNRANLKDAENAFADEKAALLTQIDKLKEEMEGRQIATKSTSSDSQIFLQERAEFKNKLLRRSEQIGSLQNQVEQQKNKILQLETNLALAEDTIAVLESRDVNETQRLDLATPNKTASYKVIQLTQELGVANSSVQRLEIKVEEVSLAHAELSSALIGTKEALELAEADLLVANKEQDILLIEIEQIRQDLLDEQQLGSQTRLKQEEELQQMRILHEERSASAAQQITLLENSLASSQKEHGALLTVNSSLETTVSAMEGSLQQTQVQLENLREQVSLSRETQQASEEKHTLIEVEKHTMLDKISTLEQELQRTRTEAASNQNQQILSLQDRLSQEESLMKNKDSQLETSKKDITRLTKEIATLRGLVSQKDETVIRLEATLAETRAEADAVVFDFNLCSAEYEKAQALIDRQQQQINQAAEERTIVLEQLRAAEQQISAIQKEVQSASNAADIADLEDQLRVRGEEMEETEERYLNSLKDIKKLQNTVEKLRVRCETLQRAVKTLEDLRTESLAKQLAPIQLEQDTPSQPMRASPSSSQTKKRIREVENDPPSATRARAIVVAPASIAPRVKPKLPPPSAPAQKSALSALSENKPRPLGTFKKIEKTVSSADAKGQSANQLLANLHALKLAPK